MPRDSARADVDTRVGIGHDAAMSLLEPTVQPVAWPADARAVIEFLAAHEWPFHGQSRLSLKAAAAVQVEAGDVASFWIDQHSEHVGLIRLFDLGDVDDGS